VSFKNFVGTLGAPREVVPWLVADRAVAPVEFRAHFSEAMLYLPESYYGAGHHIFAPHNAPLPHGSTTSGHGGGAGVGRKHVRRAGDIAAGGAGGGAGAGGSAVGAGLRALMERNESEGVAAWGAAAGALPAEGLVFGAFSNLGKVNVDVWSVWCRILVLCPHLVLWAIKVNPNPETRNFRPEPLTPKPETFNREP